MPELEMRMKDLLDELVEMSAELGSPDRDLAILGEGNTSARADAETFWVKASGVQLGRAGRDGFVRVRFAPILAALDGRPLNDAALKELLKTATAEGQRLPSIETFLHALCLQQQGVQFVGHTHPSIAVGLLSGQHSRELFSGCALPRSDRRPWPGDGLCALCRSRLAAGLGDAAGDRRVPRSSPAACRKCS